MFFSKCKAEDMKFAQVWNNDSYDLTVKNYTRRMMIYRSPFYYSKGDERGGTDNGNDTEIMLTVNVEECIVFLDNIEKAKRILSDEMEIKKLISMAQTKWETEYDMGCMHSCFIFGYGGTKASIREYIIPGITYIKLSLPSDGKYVNKNYRDAVEWNLIEKGAIYVIPEKGMPYLAVIQRKNKPRSLSPFKKFIS